MAFPEVEGIPSLESLGKGAKTNSYIFIVLVYPQIATSLPVLVYCTNSYTFTCLVYPTNSYIFTCLGVTPLPRSHTGTLSISQKTVKLRRVPSSALPALLFSLQCQGPVAEAQGPRVPYLGPVAGSQPACCLLGGSYVCLHRDGKEAQAATLTAWGPMYI